MRQFLPPPNTRPCARGAVDLDAIRRSVADMEGLCREASTTRDPRVLLLAVRVLHRRAGEIIEPFGDRP
jgi:hypothetical protein